MKKTYFKLVSLFVYTDGWISDRTQTLINPKYIVRVEQSERGLIRIYMVNGETLITTMTLLEFMEEINK
jgi:hypothetical protein